MEREREKEEERKKEKIRRESREREFKLHRVTMTRRKTRKPKEGITKDRNGGGERGVEITNFRGRIRN